MEYEDLLEKAYEKLPKVKVDEERFEIPKFEIMIQGNQTIVKNFAQVCHVLRREPKHVLKFLTKELATPANIDQTRALFQSKLFRNTVQKKLESYVKEYVLCKECKKPDTKLIKKDRVTILKCEACGATSAVR